jgi:hypothetical protein
MSRPTPPLFRRALTLDGVYVAAAVAITCASTTFASPK